MAGMHGKHELEPHESAALLQRRSSCAGRHAEPDRSDDFLVALAGALEEHSDTVTGTIIFNLNISKGTKVLAEHLPASSPCVQRSFSPARVVEGIFINGKKKTIFTVLDRVSGQIGFVQSAANAVERGINRPGGLLRSKASLW